MTTPCEYTLAEKPTIDGLVKLGDPYLNPDLHDTHRGVSALGPAFTPGLPVGPNKRDPGLPGFSMGGLSRWVNGSG